MPENAPAESPEPSSPEPSGPEPLRPKPETPDDPSPRRRFRLALLPTTRAGKIRLAILLGALLLTFLIPYWLMISMPGSSYSGPLPSMTAEESAARDRLEADVNALCSDDWDRNQYDTRGLRIAEAYIAHAFESAGYKPLFHEYDCRRTTVRNIECELPGTEVPEEIVIIGGHYDSFRGMSADDNASGTVGVLELARAFAGNPLPRTVRFVAFVNEEPPFFQVRGQMGSEVYAARSHERGEKITAMLSLEMIGYFKTEPGSQGYPPPMNLLYPDTGDFIAFVGTFENRALVRDCIRTFRKHVKFPSEGAALPAKIPGIDFSDHWSFNYHGYQAAMVTDTAFYRNPNYHTLEDRPETLDFDRMARVVVGLQHVVRGLATP